MLSRACSLLVLVLAVSVSLFGQADRGTIRGTITDSSGAVISGAEVTAVGVSTGVRISTRTTSVGSYSISDLLPGLFNVEVVQPGFKKLVRENARVSAGVITAVDITLEEGCQPRS